MRQECFACPGYNFIGLLSRKMMYVSNIYDIFVLIIEISLLYLKNFFLYGSCWKAKLPAHTIEAKNAGFSHSKTP